VSVEDGLATDKMEATRWQGRCRSGDLPQGKVEPIPTLKEITANTTPRSVERMKSYSEYPTWILAFPH
jgi:hypothetical protein